MKRKRPMKFKQLTRKLRAKRVFRPHVKVCSESDWPFPRKVCGPNQYITKKEEP